MRTEDMTDYTDEQLVSKYLAIKAKQTELKKGFEDQLKPYGDAMTLIENMLLARLIERGAQNTKTDAGTAYKVEHMNVKVEDRDAFVKFSIDHWDTIGSGLLMASPKKDEVRTYLKDHDGQLPPGLAVSYYTEVNIRKG